MQIFRLLLLGIIMQGVTLAQEPNIPYCPSAPRSAKHYAIHYATGIPSILAGCGITWLGVGAGNWASQSSFRDWVLDKLNMTYSVQGREIITELLKITPVFAALTACIWLVYKAPQWTDKYLLGIQEKRSREYNVISCLLRLLFVPPFGGIALGEYLYKDLHKEQLNLKESL